jgi:pentatricopeptide repeat protein
MVTKMNYYELAKKLYKEMLNDGWTPSAACNEACISYPLSLQDQNKLWKYHSRIK